MKNDANFSRMTNICPICNSANAPSASVCSSCSSPLTVSADHLAKGTKLHGGRYSIGKVLGEGGFGITYMGADVQLQRRVAIKELFPQGSSRQNTTVIPPKTTGIQAFREAKHRFLNEARTLAKFDHPGIVKVLDVFEENDSAYVVMAFVEGETLAQHIARKGTLDVQEVLQLALKITPALKEVHSKGLLHRDIKPDNIILLANNQPVLIDFGSTRQYQDDKTQTHSRLLTPGYAAPEQYQARGRFGAHTDIYALAATLYHCLIGQMPPTALDRLTDSKPLPPLPSGVHQNLAKVLTQSLEIRADKRPQTVSVFEEMLREGRAKSSDMIPAASAARHPNTPSQTPATPRNQQPSAPQNSQPQKRNTLVKNGLRFGIPIAIILAVLFARPSFIPSVPTSSSTQASPSIAGASAPSTQCAQTQASPQTFQPGQEAEFMSCAMAGGTIRLSAGIFRLPQTLVLSRDVEIIGAGQPRTVIQANVGHGVIEFNGSGTFGLQDLTVEHVGIQPADAIRVSDGTANFQNISAQGAVHDTPGLGGSYGAGIRFLGASQGNVEDSLTIENESTGIIYTENSSGLAKNNVSEENVFGMAVIDAAAPTLQDNTLRLNEATGIFYNDNAGGLASNNLSEGNKNRGVQVRGRAAPTLRDNTFRSNEQQGIAYFDNASGLVESSVSEYNGSYGILVSGRATPEIRSNMVENNGDYGIAFFEDAGGVAANNVVQSNRGGYFEIFCGDRARALIEGGTSQYSGRDSSRVQVTGTFCQIRN